MSTTTKSLIRRTADEGLLEIRCELREDDDPRGLSPAFSVTGALYERHGTWSAERRRNNRKDPDVAGCIHDEILRAAPELAPLVALHLADPDGVPMHAEANGWYFYSGGASAYERAHPASYHNREGLSDRERAAQALRVDVDSLPYGMDQERFHSFVLAQRARWAREAAEGRALLESL